jgi:F0F1-type ATP synthase assembly protein I
MRVLAVTNSGMLALSMEPGPRQTLHPAGAGAVLLGTTAGGIGVGALIGWAAGSWPIGALVGTMVGIPAGIFAVYRRYGGALS